MVYLAVRMNSIGMLAPHMLTHLELALMGQQVASSLASKQLLLAIDAQCPGVIM